MIMTADIHAKAARKNGWRQLAGYPKKFGGGEFWTRDADETDIANEDGKPEFATAREACEFDGIKP